MSEGATKETIKKPLAVFLADLHWTTLAPEYRKETGDFTEVIAKKLGKVYEYATKHRVPVFIAGDVFDRSREFMDMWSFAEFMRLLLDANPFSLTGYVRGQHDLLHHNPQDEATSLNVAQGMFKGGMFKGGMFEGGMILLDDSPFVCHGDRPAPQRRVTTKVYGCGYDEEPPEPHNKTNFNILLWHKGLWCGKSPYPNAPDGNVESISVGLADMGYKMVFSGDYHEAWSKRVGGVEFHNLGCFTRRSVKYANQQPRFCVLFDDLTVESIYVGETDVFDIDRSLSDKNRVITKDAFSTALALTYKTDVTIRGAIENIVKSGMCNDIKLNEAQLNMLRDVLALAES